jgi:hypothetical protein
MSMTPAEERVYKKVVERLKEELRIEVRDGGFTSPNNRTVVVKLDGDPICTASFTVAQQREYAG